jgi:hypothetical protein
MGSYEMAQYFNSNNMEPTNTPSSWATIWNEQDVRIMVLTSLALQLFLLFTGNVRRRRRVGWLKFLVWLAYLASYSLVASAIGLFSQYEDKYKIRRLESSSEHLHTLTMPFLWAPFLLLHLGGPDTITAFSIEDTSLWLRQLVNLVVQLSLALYVFWKSFDLLDSKLLAVAVPLFVAGIIKYGEKIWALRSGSVDSLDSRLNLTAFSPPPMDNVSARARNSALSCRGLLVGRTLVQLGSRAATEIRDAFKRREESEQKLEFVLTELTIIYDMIYTKAMVLQGWTGVFRCIALVSIMVAFVLFWANQHLYAQRTTNAAITYTLFIATLFVEVYSIFTVIASPWTRARARPGTFLYRLSYYPSCQGLPSPSMGQFNLIEYCMSKKSTPEFISRVSEALGLEKHWRNFWHVKHIEDKGIVDYVVGLLNNDPYCRGEQSKGLQLGHELEYLLKLPFEHALFRLHIFTEMHLSTLDGCVTEDGHMGVLVAECRKLSRYVMYLIVVYPSTMPVDIAARDPFFGNGVGAQNLESLFAQWVKDKHGNLPKEEILMLYAQDYLEDTAIYLTKVTQEFFQTKEMYKYASILSPFTGQASEESLRDMKEMWARLLIYASGKCHMGLHARQLSEGVELLTVVGILMMHHGIGDVGRKLELLAPPRARTPEALALIHGYELLNMILPEEPLYAFEFVRPSPSQEQNQKWYVQAWGSFRNQRPQTHDTPRPQPASIFTITYTIFNFSCA